MFTSQGNSNLYCVTLSKLTFSLLIILVNNKLPKLFVILYINVYCYQGNSNLYWLLLCNFKQIYTLLII